MDAMDATRTSPRHQELVAAIRRQILDGSLKAGQKLAEPALALQYGVSRVPVREAIRALASEGLVALRPFASAEVSVITDQVAREIFEIRSVLEPLAARKAALRRDDQDVDDLTALIDAARAGIAASDPEEMTRLNSSFHHAVAKASHNLQLAHSVQQIGDRTRWIYSDAGMLDRERTSWDEHELIVAAIVAGDGARAGELMRDHVCRAATDALGPTWSE